MTGDIFMAMAIGAFAISCVTVKYNKEFSDTNMKFGVLWITISIALKFYM